jgi:hypothetical protein
MAGFLRLIVTALVLAVVAKIIDKARKRSAEPPPQPEWPAWSDRQTNPRPTDESAPANTTSEQAAHDGPTWTDPIDDECPPGFPVKVKLGSGIYHVEGMMNWERTHPDRCYVSADAAEADGYRASKM